MMKSHALTTLANRLIRTFSVALLLVAAGNAYTAEGGSFLDDPSAKKYALILVGATVDEEHAKEFANWANALRTSLVGDLGYSRDNVTLLLGNGNKVGDISGNGACRMDSLQKTFSTLSSKIKPGDQLTVVMFGHGTGAGDDAKFNIVGPDITGQQFAELLNPIKTQNIAVINTTSASHDFSKTLSAPGRVIVSATRSRAEKYDTVFPKYFVDALKDLNADRDKNRRISILEAFAYANSQVENYFKESNMLASEHASLDDNGDGVLSPSITVRGDGRLAEVAYLDVLGAGTRNLPPAAAQLKARMANLEREVIMLRANKNSYEANEYWGKLETLLVQLAKATREFNAYE